MQDIYDVTFGMLEVRKNEISLRKWYGAIAHLKGNIGDHPTRIWVPKTFGNRYLVCIKQLGPE